MYLDKHLLSSSSSSSSSNAIVSHLVIFIRHHCSNQGTDVRIIQKTKICGTEIFFLLLRYLHVIRNVHQSFVLMNVYHNSLILLKVTYLDFV